MKVKFKLTKYLLICLAVISCIATGSASQQIPTSSITQVVLSPTPHFVLHQLKNISHVDSIVTSGKYAWVVDRSAQTVAFYNGVEWEVGQRLKGMLNYLVAVYTDNGQDGEAWLSCRSWSGEAQLVKMEKGVLSEPLLVRKLLGFQNESEASRVHFVFSGGYVFLLSGIIHGGKPGEYNSFFLTIYDPNTKKWSDVKKIYLPSNEDGDISAMPASRNEPGLFLQFYNYKKKYSIHLITKDGVLKPDLYQGEFECEQSGYCKVGDYYVTSKKSFLFSKNYIYYYDGFPEPSWKKITPTLSGSGIANNEFDVLSYQDMSGMFCGLMGSYLAETHQIKCVDTNNDNYWPMFIVNPSFEKPQSMTKKTLNLFMGEGNMWMLVSSSSESSDDIYDYLADPKVYDYDFKSKKTVDTQLEGILQGNNKLHVKIIPDNKILLCSTGSSQIPVKPTVLYYDRKSENPNWVRVNGESISLTACGFSDEDYDGETYGIHHDGQMRGDTLWLFERPKQ